MLDRTSVADWLRRETDIAPEQVVAVSPSAVTAMLAITPGGETADFQVHLRALALSPEAAARNGVAAWEMWLEVDCVRRRVRAGPTVGFTDRRASGQGSPLTPPDPDWRRPRAGTQLDSVLGASCDTHFSRPLLDTSGEPPRTVVARARSAMDRGVAREAIAPEPAAAASVDPAAKTVSRAMVQVVSSPEPADVKAKLARLGSRMGQAMAELTTSVEPATVRGRSVYRGMVSGFATRSDAAAFCQALKAGGQDCVLR